jgi:TonB family protein
MKNVNKLAVLLSLAALLAPALKAKSLEETYLETCRKDVGVPVPVVVVSPDVPANYAGLTVEIAFTVEASGKTSTFSVKSSPDAELGATVVDAVKKWRFKPAVTDGVAVATKVVLPIRIVEAPFAGARFAAN